MFYIITSLKKQQHAIGYKTAGKMLSVKRVIIIIFRCKVLFLRNFCKRQVASQISYLLQLSFWHRDRPKMDFTFSAENENETESNQIKQQHMIFSLVVCNSADIQCEITKRITISYID